MRCFGSCSGSAALLVQLIESGLTRAQSDSAVDISRLLAVAEANLKVLGLRAEHIQDLFLLGLPVIELASVHVISKEVFLQLYY